MLTIYRYLILLFGTFACIACTSSKSTQPAPPEAPDYSQAAMWYGSPEMTEEKPADVFYVTPTCVWDWRDEHGHTQYYMNVNDSLQRAAVDGSNLLAYALFGKSCRFYSPYYRQITMNSWFESETEINRRYELSHSDIVRAFRYYMDHCNQGRPFILAGHSQGAKAVIELLKNTLTPEQYARMVAAYVFGFTVSQDELAGSHMLKPAAGADDTGVTICYNSVSKADARSPMFADNVVCINPVNWKTDGTYAPASENLGSVFFDAHGRPDTLYHTVGVRLDPAIHTLIIDGLSDDDYYIRSIERLFPKGNYHVQELNLYFLNVQQNIGTRIDSFLHRNSR